VRHRVVTLTALAIACAAATAAGCGSAATSSVPTGATSAPASTSAATPTAAPSIASVSGLGLITNIVAPDDSSGRLFVTDQVGVIRIVREGKVASTPALDIRSKVGSASTEQGLLGLAFPPGFAGKQRAYIYFTDPGGTSRVYRIRVSADDPDTFDPASMQLLLSIAQPYPNHNGGQLAFGPDGYLYLGFGDGGSEGDPGNRAQNLGLLLGKILRIDVESSPGAATYGVPSDNPFVGEPAARPEIWEYGLRNPWRFSFDPSNGDMWIGDVGQDKWEEIDHVASGSAGGLDFGWPLYEGNHLYKATTKGTGVVWPVAEYAHPVGDCVTGGYVYRGSAFPGEQGLYVFGDYITGKIWTLQRTGVTWAMRLATTTNWGITTFGVDGTGELWAADRNTGTIHRLGDLSR
jgi:glucose/arabinose dehydrogenase